MTQRVEAPAIGQETEPTGLQFLARYLFCGGVAGTIAGIVFLGAGSRIVMRLAFLLDPEEEGALTENGNTIGAITAEGTIGILVFVGLFGGLIAGLLWVLVREWLPAQFWLRAALGGVSATLLGSFMVVSAANRDFLILDPPAANIGLFLTIVGLAGSATAVLDQWLQRRLPLDKRAAVMFGALVLLGGLLSVPLLVQAFVSEDFCVCESPPRFALPFLALAGIATVMSWSRFIHGFHGSAREPSWRRPLGVAGVIGACTVAAIDLMTEIRSIV
jgi:hypothetical protein